MSTGYDIGEAMGPTRPYDFMVSWDKRGCIFADFKKVGESCKLVRISFDGYGCYDCEEDVELMESEDARQLMDWANSKTIGDGDSCDHILARYMTQNKEALARMADALEEYHLLESNA